MGEPAYIKKMGGPRAFLLIIVASRVFPSPFRDSPAKRRTDFKSLLDFWRGDQSDDNENLGILGKTAKKCILTEETSDNKIYKVNNCTDGTDSLLLDGFGNQIK